jgi:hypothetical protein
MQAGDGEEPVNLPGGVPQRQTAAPRFRRAGDVLQRPQSRRVDECHLAQLEIDAGRDGPGSDAARLPSSRACIINAMEITYREIGTRAEQGDSTMKAIAIDDFAKGTTDKFS